MDRISSTSIITSQSIQKGVRGYLATTNKWVIAAVAGVVLVPLIFTGFICFALPMMGFAVLLFHAYEMRFKNPVSTVWLDGDKLIMERREEIDRIRLADIRSLKLSRYNNPPYIVMTLIVPSRWGDTLTWFPSRLSSFGEMPTLVAELQKRIDQTRVNQTGDDNTREASSPK
ncbi:hypothetical protein [Rhodopirellula sp. SWK7]|uniref:hypothetical protein n=1 Tax=Rhodopirellula sp. SWK7 TaxID=595460 RepID=UPI0002BF32BA|nr:hypothetical protein [Rhodopirellula sp. SWK7]EMI47445.1 hypothetical protein RRSWK_00065 [Rhodopirellula sp. SWK7]